MGDVRVLVVDDQEPYLRAMTTVVEETDGFVVVGSASSGEEAVEVAADVRPDLILLDVHLPGIDGLDASRRINDAVDSDGPVVVLLSTYDEDQLDVTGCGAAAYVPKAAFGPDRLAEIWQRHGKDAVA
jgi:DNA-binding NarL/FixJ family response regulator